jgi:signal transduction histidine kinase
MPESTWIAAAAEAVDPGAGEGVVLGMRAYLALIGALQAQLQRSERLEGLASMARSLAHDLNNVLTPIQLGLNLLREARTGEARRLLEDVLQARLDRARELVQQLLFFARDPGTLVGGKGPSDY